MSNSELKRFLFFFRAFYSNHIYINNVLSILYTRIDVNGNPVIHGNTNIKVPGVDHNTRSIFSCMLLLEGFHIVHYKPDVFVRKLVFELGHFIPAEFGLVKMLSIRLAKVGITCEITSGGIK